MRRKLLLFVLAIIALTYCAQAQQATNGQQAVQQCVTDMFTALSNRDSVDLKKYCAGDVLFFEYGLTWTIDTMINKAIVMNQSADFKRINKLEFVNTEIKGNTAWTSYNLHSDIAKDGKQVAVHWMETVVLAKEQNKWKIKVLHSTLVKRS